MINESGFIRSLPSLALAFPKGLSFNGPMSKISIRSLSVLMQVGVTEPERLQPQEVQFGFELQLPKPKAVLTDRIEDTVCYESICNLIRETATAKPVHTLEYLANEILIRFKERFPVGTQALLRIKKVKPPIPGLLEGVEYEQRMDE